MYSVISIMNSSGVSMIRYLPKISLKKFGLNNKYDY